MQTFGGAKLILRVTYIGLLLSLYANFLGSRGMATEARSNSGMGSRRLAIPMLDSSIPYRSWKKNTNVDIGLWCRQKRARDYSFIAAVI